MVMNKMNCENLEMRDRAFRICRDYLHGAWKHLAPGELVVKRISGGLSNWLYLCTLPASRPPRGNEPTQVLLRLYGQIHGERALEGLITESVIFTLLSERRLGPRLHGVFPGGRLEEYIPARPLRSHELSDSKLSTMIGEKIALVHSMNVPISKEPRWLWDTMSRWLQSLQEPSEEQNTSPKTAEMLRRVHSFNLSAELKWLRKVLSRIGSPVVFAHNDLQEGNILLRDGSPPRLVLIDFEYCSYNYRGFDLANHFCEWTYDYTLQQAPNFTSHPELYPSREQQLVLVRSYLATMAKEKQKLQGGDQLVVPTSEEEEAVLKEILYFTLASHFFWSLWSLVNSRLSQIPFGYMEYANTRLEAYFAHKSQLLSEDCCKMTLNPGHVPGEVPGQVPGSSRSCGSGSATSDTLKRKATEME